MQPENFGLAPYQIMYAFLDAQVAVGAQGAALAFEDLGLEGMMAAVRGQPQGNRVSPDFPGRRSLGEPLGQVDGGSQYRGFPRLPISQGGPQHQPAGDPGAGREGAPGYHGECCLQGSSGIVFAAAGGAEYRQEPIA